MSNSPVRPRRIALGQHWTSHEVARFMLDLLESPPGTEVMESGAGRGAFVEVLLSAGYPVTAYEYDPENVAHLQATYPAARVVPGDFLTSAGDERFRAALGNPPYVHWNNIGDDTRTILRGDPFWAHYVSGEWDLLYAFIIWQVEKLEQGGELCLIVPVNWFLSTHAASLRRYLAAHGTFREIASFGEFSPFADAAPNTIIFRYVKETPDPAHLIRVLELTASRAEVPALLAAWRAELQRFHGTARYEVVHDGWRAFTRPQFPGDGLWYLASPSEEEALVDLETACLGTQLSDVANVGVGVVSGYDEAYRLSEEEYAALPQAERDLVHPFVRAANCRRWRVDGSAHYIFPEHVDEEAKLRRRYPTLAHHLDRHRDRLGQRYISARRRWWQWATVRNLPLFETNRSGPKIFVPGIDRALRARYSLYRGDAMALGDVLTIVPRPETRENARFWLAWLNSAAINAWYRAKGNRTGHRVRFTQSYVERIPVLRLDWNNPDEVAIHDQVLRRVQDLLDGQVADMPALEAELDGLLERLISAHAVQIPTPA